MSKRGADEVDGGLTERDEPKKQVVAGGAAAGAGGPVRCTRDEFMGVYERLKEKLAKDIFPKYEMPEEAIEWISRMTEYNVPGGKLNRGLTVVDSLSIIKGRALTEEEMFDAALLGWCVEWLQACFLIADDVMDASVTRRGQPCWYKQDDVKLIAINDAFLLRSSLLLLLKEHFGSHPDYVRLYDIFTVTTAQTELGQLLDLTSAPMGGKVDLSRFTVERHRLIVKYKTSFYSFYLPIALAMILGGETDPTAFTEAEDILTQMGVYFQVQDDYLDCYGDPEVIGKIGTDIQDNKCGWLVVQALERATADQRQLLQDHYGRDVPESIQKVKDLYKEMKLEDVYHAYEAEAVKSLREKIDGRKSSTPAAVFTAMLDKIYKRSK